jgi:hypothetical protein
MPCKATIHNIITKLCSTGSVWDKKESWKGQVLTEEKTDDISTRLEASSNESLRLLTLQCGLANRKTAVHSLLCPDCESRIRHCWSFQERIFNFLTQNFHVNGQNNEHCNKQNPHAVHEVPLHDLKVCVMCVISVRRISGPSFFHNKINSERYVKLIVTLLRSTDRRKKKSYEHFMQENVKAHNVHNSMNVWTCGTRRNKKCLWTLHPSEGLKENIRHDIFAILYNSFDACLETFHVWRHTRT